MPANVPLVEMRNIYKNFGFFMVLWSKSEILDASATVYASAHDASAPDGEWVSVRLFSVFFEFFFCFEGFFAALEFLFLHLCSL